MMGVFMSWMSSLSDREMKSCQPPKAYVGLTQRYQTKPETLEESKILLIGYIRPVDMG